MKKCKYWKFKYLKKKGKLYSGVKGSKGAEGDVGTSGIKGAKGE